MSELTAETIAMQKQYGFSAGDLAAAYIQVIHASLLNVVPTVFWVLAHVFSRRQLLSSLREEVIKAVKQQDSQGGGKQVAIDVGRMDSACPKLLAVFREAHRLASVETLHRRVLDNTFLTEEDGIDGRSYLFKRGVTVMIPTTVSLRDQRLWGDTAEEFDTERFLEQAYKQPKSKDSHTELKGLNSISNLRRKAYFPFGGGKELCPGRNFATTEVMGMLAVLISGFDISSLDGSAISLPRAGKPKLTTGTARPDQTADLRAGIPRRPGWENIVWDVAIVGDERI